MVYGVFNVIYCSKMKVLFYYVEVNLFCSEKFLEIIWVDRSGCEVWLWNSRLSDIIVICDIVIVIIIL